MKELSIEEKAKAYDSNYKNYAELINRLEDVKEAIKKQNYGIAMDILCKPYPDFQVTTHSELKESEDERIRKYLSSFVKLNSGINLPPEDAKKMLAWLEKQGEKTSDKIVEKARTEKQRVLLTETDGSANIDWDCRSLDDVKILLKCGLEFIRTIEANKQILTDNRFGGCSFRVPTRYDKGIKQGEQKPTIEMKTPEESLGIDSDTYNKIVDECVYGEQKPIKEHNACEFCEDRYGCVNPCSMKLIEKEKHADEIKPKFKVGDWLIYENGSIFYVNKVYEHTYELVIDNGDKPRIPHEIIDKKARLWTIQDAKNGDVLVSESTCGLGTWYCIFKSLDGDESMTVYCYLTRDGRFETKKELCFDKDPYNTKPATKEQRNTLMKAMTDAGYEWDAEKKELKNIEEEYNGEDYGIDGLYAAIDILQKTLGEVDGYQSDDGILTHKCAINAVKELSKQKPAWGEEDKDFMYDTLSNLTELKDRYGEGYGNVGKCIDWLKSIKERCNWKPSNEQMDALHYVTNFDYGGHKATLVSLYEQLKKLKG